MKIIAALIVIGGIAVVARACLWAASHVEVGTYQKVLDSDGRLVGVVKGVDGELYRSPR